LAARIGVAEATCTSGVFRAADNPSVRVAGELIIEVGKGALANLTNNLRPDARVTLFNEPDGRISGFAVAR
jgi:hypothetical protein